MRFRTALMPAVFTLCGSVVLAYLIRVGLLFAVGDWVVHDLRVDLAGLIALGIAGFISAGRLR